MFAAIYLVPGGRLVYWLPTVNEEYTHADIPLHPRLRLVSNCEQNFGKWARRLITMEKLMASEPDLEFDSGNHIVGHKAAPSIATFRKTYFQEK